VKKEKIFVVGIKKNIQHFLIEIFLVCIHTWTTCIIRRSSHQRVPQLAGPRFEPYLVTGRRDAKPLYRNIDTWKETI